MSKEWEVDSIPAHIIIDGDPMWPVNGDVLYQIQRSKEIRWSVENQKAFVMTDGYAGKKFGDALRLVNNVLREVAETEGINDDVPYFPGASTTVGVDDYSYKDTYAPGLGGSFRLLRKEEDVFSEVAIAVTKANPYISNSSILDKEDGTFDVVSHLRITDLSSGIFVPKIERLASERIDTLQQDERRRGGFERTVGRGFADIIAGARNWPTIVFEQG